MRILFIEDDLLFGERVKKFLSQLEYVVDWVQEIDRSDTVLTNQEHFDLIILDLDVPGLVWRTWLKKFRKHNQNIPILVLTASDEMSETLSAGADAHFSKRFFKKYKLLATIRALLRKSDIQSTSNALNFKDVTMNLDSRKVSVGDRSIDLNRREFAILHKLMSAKGKVVTREQLSQSVYGDEVLIDSNALEVHLVQLRRKLVGHYIKTIRGVGYTMNEDA